MSTSYLAFVISMLTSVVCIGQHKKDSLAILQSKEVVLTAYEKSMEGTHHLYNGYEYDAYEPLDEEHPYFETEEWTFSEFKYDGEWFRKVPLLYDINKNKLITSYYYNGAKMQLIQNRVDEFIISSHHFINIKETTDSTTLKKGFYELLYQGKNQVLAKRIKNYQETIDGIDVHRSFKESNQVYVISEGKPKRINGKRDVINIFKSKKALVRNYIRENHLFQSDKEKSVVEIVKYVDSLSK